MNLNLVSKIGPKTEKILNKINIFTVEDLLTYYPYRYNVIKFINIRYVIESVNESPKNNLVVSDRAAKPHRSHVRNRCGSFVTGAMA